MYLQDHLAGHLIKQVEYFCHSGLDIEKFLSIKFFTDGRTQKLIVESHVGVYLGSKIRVIYFARLSRYGINCILYN